ncbi:MAG TPA: enoyl-CoA hydratase-related protein [Solirubrobacteraceae bacterium]|jgi:enoyl-CoA hydratase/3-hydroxyacyl-CoA dehydrogenase|nr:enoyl-CoA hydratase-related protein [Solirubrobacteraceae bacterium]
MRTKGDLDAGALNERYALKAFVEACLILEDGVAAAKDIDFGMVAGANGAPPFASADQAGLDAMVQCLERAAGEWGEDFLPPTILRRLVAQGRLGVKTGQGFFPYPRPDAGWAQRPVKLESRGEIAIAWLDRPPANSLSPEVLDAMTELWEHVTGSPAIRVLVFASANPMLFCAGADIKAFQRLDATTCRSMVDGAHELFGAFAADPVVTIAAVNAAALGGGCELAMACDLRIAADSASFGQPEVNLGIIPGFGATQRLPRLVGRARALELNLIGDEIGSAAAFDYGLVNRVVPDHELLDTTLGWARKLAGQAPLAVAEIKRVSGADQLEAGLAAEKDAFVTAFTSDDAREGIAAFLDKRAPHWNPVPARPVRR